LSFACEKRQSAQHGRKQVNFSVENDDMVLRGEIQTGNTGAGMQDEEQRIPNHHQSTTRGASACAARHKS
jgi:hypothetical protein